MVGRWCCQSRVAALEPPAGAEPKQPSLPTPIKLTKNRGPGNKVPFERGFLACALKNQVLRGAASHRANRPGMWVFIVHASLAWIRTGH